MVVADNITTQDVGIPITYEELSKIHLLEELGVINSIDYLNSKHYSEDRAMARRQFLKVFEFYNIIKVDELQKVQYLWTQYFDYCVPPSKLLDPSRYSPDLSQARIQFEHRLPMFDCFKGIIGVFGKLRTGKSGFTAVHAHHGLAWFDLPVVTYKTKYAKGFGEFTYIKDDDLLEEILKVTNIIEKKKGEDILKWVSEEAKEKSFSLFKKSILVIDEGHKVFPKGYHTRLGRLLYHMAKEWGHYQFCLIIICDDPDDLNKDIVKRLTHEVWVSRNTSKDRTSDIRVHNMDTGEHKPLISLYRPTYYPLWQHNAPVAAESNISNATLNKMTIKREV